MQSMKNLDIVFWAGVAVILFFYIGFLKIRYSNEIIDLKEEKWFLLIYIILLIFTLVVWRYMFDTIFSPKLLHFLVPRHIEGI